MISLDNCFIERCVVHKVGNAYVGEESLISNKELKINENEAAELKSILLKRFKSPQPIYKFYHSIKLKHNVIYSLVDDLFNDSSKFLDVSGKVVKYLYDQSSHHSIKSGEVFVIQLDEVIYENILTKAIGIFKCEEPVSFIKAEQNSESIQLLLEKGIASKSIEKGCIIFNNEPHDGYTLYNYEKEGANTQYWSDNFLSLKQKANNFNLTTSLLESYRKFINEEISSEQLTKSEKNELVAKSINHLIIEDHEAGVVNFSKLNLPSEDLQEKFLNYHSNYLGAQQIENTPKFQYSLEAARYQMRKFKSVIKLDKNFHIYIHGSPNLIEHGFDSKKGKKFYKIYFDEER